MDLISVRLIQGHQISPCALPSHPNSIHLREYDSILLTELLYFLWTKLLAISGHTKVSKSQADPYKNDLGDLSFYPQFYPLQIPLVALPDLLGGTPLLLFI